FLLAFDIKTGKQVWRVDRPDETSSWATPLIYEGPTRTELITMAPRFARSYDPLTGKELWRLGKHTPWVSSSPFAGLGMVFLTSSDNGDRRPIYAVRPGATGDITLKDGETSNESVMWMQPQGGAWLPTPVLYADLLYVV